MLTPVILLAFADNRKNLDQLIEERRTLDDLLTGPFQVEQKDCATLSRIEQVFRVHRRRIRIFHFGGHADGRQIELMQGKDGHKGGYVAGVAEFIGRQKGVQLVFLNACSTVGQVQAFIDANVPAVIATTSPVRDKVASTFAQLLYQSFTEGRGKKPLREAFEEARSLLMGRFEAFEQLYDPLTRDRLGMDQIETFPYRLHTRTDRDEDLCYQDLMVGEEGEPRPVPPRAYLLVNRDDSTDAFKEELQIRLTQAYRRPVLYLVHGEEAELPLQLCDRLEHFSLGKAYKRTKGTELERARLERIDVDMPRQKDFGRKHKAMDWVKESLSSKLQMEDFQGEDIREMSGLEVLAHLDRHLRVALFRHRLYPDRWDSKFGPEFLQQYLGQFWNIDLPEHAPEIVLLFSLQYPPRRGLLGRFSQARYADKR